RRLNCYQILFSYIGQIHKKTEDTAKATCFCNTFSRLSFNRFKIKRSGLVGSICFLVTAYHMEPCPTRVIAETDGFNAVLSW
ncbi:MAG: hypothetical protein RR593_02710, partial [Hungatella sp.]